MRSPDATVRRPDDPPLSRPTASAVDRAVRRDFRALEGATMRTTALIGCVLGAALAGCQVQVTRSGELADEDPAVGGGDQKADGAEAGGEDPPVSSDEAGAPESHPDEETRPGEGTECLGAADGTSCEPEPEPVPGPECEGDCEDPSDFVRCGGPERLECGAEQRCVPPPNESRCHNPEAEGCFGVCTWGPEVCAPVEPGQFGRGDRKLGFAMDPSVGDCVEVYGTACTGDCLGRVFGSQSVCRAMCGWSGDGGGALPPLPACRGDADCAGGETCQDRPDDGCVYGRDAGCEGQCVPGGGGGHVGMCGAVLEGEFGWCDGFMGYGVQPHNGLCGPVYGCGCGPDGRCDGRVYEGFEDCAATCWPLNDPRDAPGGDDPGCLNVCEAIAGCKAELCGGDARDLTGCIRDCEAYADAWGRAGIWASLRDQSCEDALGHEEDLCGH